MGATSDWVVKSGLLRLWREKRCEEDDDRHQKAKDKKAFHTGSYKVKLYKNCIKKKEEELYSKTQGRPGWLKCENENNLRWSWLGRQGLSFFF